MQKLNKIQKIKNKSKSTKKIQDVIFIETHVFD